jgi:hypothetical protein
MQTCVVTTQDALANDNGLQLLSLKEIDQVSGGFDWLESLGKKLGRALVEAAFDRSDSDHPCITGEGGCYK